MLPLEPYPQVKVGGFSTEGFACGKLPHPASRP